MKKNVDDFAKIAFEEHPVDRIPLFAPKPLSLEAPEWTALPGGDPWAEREAGVDFESRKSHLRAELQALKDRMRPFLEKKAPPPALSRKTQGLRTFQYRRVDSPYSPEITGSTGEDVWEEVTIPHYRGPTGKAYAAYRTSFHLEQNASAEERTWLSVESVDYRCRVFVNGHSVGFHEGFFEPFEFDVTDAAAAGLNELILVVENDATTKGCDTDYGTVDGDKIYAATGPGWDEPEAGWHHCPPGMGIIGEIRVEQRPTRFVHNLFVRPMPGKDSVQIWIEVFNSDRLPCDIGLRISIHGRNFEATPIKDLPVECDPAGPGVSRYRVNLGLEDYRLWNPETPWLYEVHCEVWEQETLRDALVSSFGMRSFRQDEYRGRKGMFFLNDRPIRLRGANTMGHEQQCVMTGNEEQLIDDILLTKLANMNFWRLTQRPVQKAVYEACDALGLMTQTDLPLFGFLRPNVFSEAVRQCGTMERLVRNHPCNVVISYINEPFGNKPGKGHRVMDREELERFFRAADETVLVHNPDRVIKAVDGDYDPPGPGLPDNHCYCLWYNMHGLPFGKLHRGYWIKVKKGWYYGCGEYGAEGLDHWDLMQRRYPQSWLPDDGKDPEWTPTRIYKAQSGNIQPLFFDEPSTPLEWIARSQSHQAWATRMMTEAFRRDPRMVSIAIHLGIDAWPAGWMKTIMDCERTPKPAYFAYRKALEPLMVSLRGDRSHFYAGEKVSLEVWLCNDRHERVEGLQLEHRIEAGGTVIGSHRETVSIREVDSACVGMLTFSAPEGSGRKQLRVRSRLRDAAGTLLYETDWEGDVHPPLPETEVTLSAIGKDAEALVAAMGQTAQPLPADTVANHCLLISDPEAYLDQRECVDKLLRQGLRVIFLQLPLGKHDIAGEHVEVKETQFGKLSFVARVRSHPWMEHVEERDFAFWYDEEEDCAAPFCDSFLEVEDARWVLKTGNVGWGTTFSREDYRPVAVEKPIGRGRLVINQVSLLHRVGKNPPAARFLRKMIEKEGGSKIRKTATDTP